jgi:hypothetical protein
MVSMNASSNIRGIRFYNKTEDYSKQGLVFIYISHGLQSVSNMKSYPNISKHHAL